MDKIKLFDKKDLRNNMPELKSGMKVRVWQKIKEADKERLQAFEGVVIAVKHGRGKTGAFTVRKISGGIGVERIFPLHALTIEKIEVLSQAKVRRAKLYYIREKVAREIKRQMRRMQMMTLSTESATEVAQQAEKDAAEAAKAEAKAAEEQAAKEVEEKAAAEDKEAAEATPVVEDTATEVVEEAKEVSEETPAEAEEAKKD